MNYRCWIKGLIPVFMFVFSVFITIIMLSGCSGNIIDVLRDARSPTPIDRYWKVVSIDGVSVDQLFLQGNEDVESDKVKFIANKWGFFPNGSMTHEIGFSVTEEYPDIVYDPVPSLTVNMLVTLDGSFTIEGNIITIGTQEQHPRAYATLDPFDYWYSNLEDAMVEQLRKDVAEESLSNIPDFTNSIFLENTVYMWDWDENTEFLTFSRIFDANTSMGPYEIVMEAYDPS